MGRAAHAAPVTAAAAAWGRRWHPRLTAAKPGGQPHKPRSARTHLTQLHEHRALASLEHHAVKGDDVGVPQRVQAQGLVEKGLLHAPAPASMHRHRHKRREGAAAEQAHRAGCKQAPRCTSTSILLSPAADPLPARLPMSIVFAATTSPCSITLKTVALQVVEEAWETAAGINRVGDRAGTG